MWRAITEMGRGIQVHVCDSPELYVITGTGRHAGDHGR